MDQFEYKVIPAPRRSVRVKGAKGFDGKFAATLEKAINELAADGWQYLRAESLPADERHGITMRKTESYQNVLVFCRPADATENAKPATALLEDQSDDEAVDDAEEGLVDEDNGEESSDTQDDAGDNPVKDKKA